MRNGRPKVSIRPATRRDVPQVVRLVRDLAAFEKLGPPSPAAVRRYVKHGFGPKRYFRILLVKLDGAAVGYAFYFFTYSTFLARPSLYLEDVFVLPEARSRGVGREIMRALGRIARKEGCGRMEWCVLDWNVRAQKFYDRLGARHMKHWYFYRIDGPRLKRLAK